MRTTIISLLFLVFVNLNGQNYIGMHKDTLAVELKKADKNFKLDNSTVNKAFKYVKYVDKINEQTWLFFLDDNDLCTYHKLMSDYLNYQDVLDKLNEKYLVEGKMIWAFEDNNKLYQVTLTEGEWFFTVLTKEKK